MIFRGFAREGGKEYIERFKQQALDALQQYPQIAAAVQGFSEFTEGKYDSNRLFVALSTSVSDVFRQNQPNVVSKMICDHIESVLGEIVPRLTNSDKKYVFSRLSSFDRLQSNSVMQELLFCQQLLLAGNDIEYESLQGGRHDVRVKLAEDVVNVELTQLGQGEFQKIVETAFGMAAEKILENLEEGSLLKLDVDVSRVALPKNNDAEKISCKILGGFAILEPLIIAERNSGFLTPKNLGEPNKLLAEIPYLDFFEDLWPRIQKIQQSHPEFLKKTTAGEIENNPISGALYGDATAKLVEIHSLCMFPSLSEEKRIESLMRQLEDRIRDKIDSGQLNDLKNTVMAIEFRDIHFHNYSIHGFFEDERRDQLIDTLKPLLKDGAWSGLMVYDGNISNSFIILNSDNQLTDVARQWIEKNVSLVFHC